MGGDSSNYYRYLFGVENLNFPDLVVLEDSGHWAHNILFVKLRLGKTEFNAFGAVFFSSGLVLFCRNQPRPWLALACAMPYLFTVVCRGFNARVRLVGSDAVSSSDLPVEVVAWELKNEFEQSRNLDVGVMPLPDELWARGKCGFKLIQYMGCGLLVVASPIGANTEIVTNGVNGFLATPIDKWVLTLEKLLRDVDLRGRLGQAERAKVEEAYCLSVTALQFTALLSLMYGDYPCAQ